MKLLRPKTILIVGPVAMFFATLLPALLLLRGEHAWYGALVLAVLNAVFLGVPISTALAWGSYWSFRKPDANPYQLDRWYRYVERNLALAGMGAVGFMAGVGVSALASQLEGEAHSRMVIGIVALVLVGMVSIMFFAIAKIALVQRLEYLQTAIQKLEQDNKPSP